MRFNALFLFALSPLFAFAQSDQQTTTSYMTVQTTVRVTSLTVVTMTGVPPDSISATATPTAVETPTDVPGAAGKFSISSGVGAVVIGAIAFGMM